MSKTNKQKIKNLEESKKTNDEWIKQIFERIVSLETKVDLIGKNIESTETNRERTVRYFIYVTILIIALEVLTFAANYWIIRGL